METRVTKRIAPGAVSRTFTGSVLLATALTPTHFTHASSFQILEQSPAYLGRAFAGTASDPTDASTVFFNPAAMTRLQDRSVTVGGNAVLVEAEFEDSGSSTGGSSGKTDEVGLVPNLYLVQPFNDDWRFGFGVNAPFGLASKYDDDWIGRYLATNSELELVNVNGTLAYQVNRYLSLGVGLNYQQIDVTLGSQIDSTLGVSPSPMTDSSATIRGEDDGVVLDLSLHLEPVPDLSFGLLWRQGGDFSLDGNAQFVRNELCNPGAGFPTGAPPAPTTGSICANTLDAREGDVSADVALPDTLTFSASWELRNKWDLHADIAWTQWSSIDAIEIVRAENDVLVDQLDLQYDDTLRYAIGTTYTHNEDLTLRAGLALDEAPQTDPELVTPRIPDQDRTWLSLGFRYALSDTVTMDVGYAHVFVDETEILDVDPQTGHRVEGVFEPGVDIVGIQANWRF